MSDFSPLSTLKRLATGHAGKGEPSMLGRFELRRILGQGAQSVVWQAFDPRLERDVAIKFMKVGSGVDASVIPQWLREARSVSRLAHANIVPVFEADVHDQQPYLVFEYVPGTTLAALLAARGALPLAEATALMLDVLDALVAAHGAGVVHRDLKPSNVLVDESGRARVMDFGIAALAKDRSPADAAGREDGTPGYMSPEATQGQPAAPSMDIFAAGLVFVEMLTGQPLIAGQDPYRAIYRVSQEQLLPPDDLGPGVDDGLRAMLRRALDRDPAQRQPSAKAFRDALVHWSDTAFDAEPADGGATTSVRNNSTLDFLLRRMRHKSDFPAMSDSVLRIQGMANSDTESIGSVTNEILQDVALTNKLLRLVNSAHYARGGGSISTVSRAVSLVGFNGIRNIALSLVLLEHMQDKAHANVLKAEFLRSLLAGYVAGELCPTAREREEAFIGAMFQNLGHLLAEFYFPEETQAIRGLVAAPHQPLSEAAACVRVLGLDFETLGLGVARAWALPDGIRRCMRKPVGTRPMQLSQEPVEQMRWIAVVANEIADILLRADPQAREAELAQAQTRCAHTLGVPARDIEAATLAARKKLIDMAQAMDLQVLPGSQASRLLQEPGQGAATVTQKMDATSSDALAPLELQATRTGAFDGPAVARHDPLYVAQILTAGIQDITTAMVDDGKLNDLLRMVLETMFRALDFQHIVFCMRDPKTETLTGRFGLGRDIEPVVKAFAVALKANPPDLFAAVCLRGADTMIGDATDPRITARLPAWYRRSVNAPTFLMLPLLIKGKPFGLIYADQAHKGGLALDEKELALLRTLRNQAVMAFKQSA